MNESFNNTKIEKDHYRNQMEINFKKNWNGFIGTTSKWNWRPDARRWWKRQDLHITQSLASRKWTVTSPDPTRLPNRKKSRALSLSLSIRCPSLLFFFSLTVICWTVSWKSAPSSGKKRNTTRCCPIKIKDNWAVGLYTCWPGKILLASPYFEGKRKRRK